MPSFDCNKAINKVENAICSTNALANLDYSLATLYKQILEKTDDKEAVIEKQRAWLLRRNRSCERSTDIVKCLSDKYSERITEIRSDPLMSVAPLEDNNFPLTSVNERNKANFELLSLFLDENNFKNLYGIKNTKINLVNDKLILDYVLYFDNNLSNEIISSLIKVLDQISISKEERTFNNERVKINKDLLKNNKVFSEPYCYHSSSDPRGPIDLNTICIPLNVSKFIVYELDENYCHKLYDKIYKINDSYIHNFNNYLVIAFEILSKNKIIDKKTDKINIFNFLYGFKNSSDYCRFYIFPYISTPSSSQFF
jgi:uncharacterized protein